MHEKLKILNVDISAINLDLACREIEELIAQRKTGYVCVAPVSTLISCQEDEKYKDIINNAHMATPDGMPLVWIARSLGYKQVRRTYGPDLMLELCDFGQDKGYKHYLLGGSEDALGKLEVQLKENFPNINIVGKYSPPFRDLNCEEHADMLSNINNSQADVLWVGLGSPKQEFWMKENCDKLNVPVLIGVGAAFDFLAGTKPQAPKWMQRSGLEWLFRFCSEPKRLARRYIVGNSKFIYLIVKSFLKGELKKNGSK